MKKLFKTKKPTREELEGFSPSELKTFIKQLGHKVPRDFFAKSSISKYKNRYYRWRWWGSPYSNDSTFVVDISCLQSNFDRWANSAEDCVNFKFFKKKIDKKILDKKLKNNLANNFLKTNKSKI